MQEQGTHRQLLEQGRLYAKMWKDYQQAAAWKVGNPAVTPHRMQAADTGRAAAGWGKRRQKKMTAKLQHIFALSEKGARDFVKAVIWCFLCEYQPYAAGGRGDGGDSAFSERAGYRL